MGNGRSPAAGPGRKGWASRRKRLHAWRPDQTVLGLLELRRLWLKIACAAPFDLGNGS